MSSISVKPRCLSIVDLLLELAGATLANRRDFRRGAKNRTRRPVQMNVTKLQNQTTYLRRRSNKLPIGGVYGWGCRPDTRSATGQNNQRLAKTHREVECADMFGQCAHRDEIHAGFREFAQRFIGDVT